MALLDEGRKKRPREVPTTQPQLLEMLSDEDKARLRQQAQERVLKEKKKQAEDAYLAEMLEIERRALEPEMETRQIVIDLAPFSNKILIDNREFHHGHVYEVTKHQFDTIMEMMSRSWSHDYEVGEPNRKFYQRPSHLGVFNYAGLTQQPRDVKVSEGTIDGEIAKQQSVVHT